MLAVITGASSGLGAEFARQLDKMGYNTVIVARRRERLEELKRELTNNCEIFVCDLSKKENCLELFKAYPDADVLINNAGLGKFGEIAKSDIDSDINVISTDVTACYLLLKLYLQRFMQRKSGYILNTASAAAFMPGPYFALYYASKAFVLNVSQGAYGEAIKNNVFVSAFCPGSIDTEFNSVAKTSSSSKPYDKEKAVKYALKMLFRKKPVIIPGFKIKAARFFSRFMPDSLLIRFSSYIQKRR